jgi:hypothetical protein
MRYVCILWHIRSKQELAITRQKPINKTVEWYFLQSALMPAHTTIKYVMPSLRNKWKWGAVV